MKTILLPTLFILFTMGLHAQEKTYILNIEHLTLNSATISWHRADGTSEKDSTQAYTSYCVEYGIKGFERSIYTVSISSWAGCVLEKLVPDTEYSLFIRKQSVSADSSVWFEEYNFRTLPCRTEIANIKTEMEYANGIHINDLLDVHISFDQVADSYELEYGLKGFEKGSGTRRLSHTNRFSIGNAQLHSTTEYDFYIRAICNDEPGEWSATNTFATTDVYHYSGIEAFDIHFENITNNSVSVQWKKIVGGSYSKYYRIEYGPKGFIRGTGQTETSLLNFADLRGLEDDTEYSLFIRSNDISSTDSVWYTEHTFKTLPCNTEVSGVESTELWLTDYSGRSVIEIKWDDMADSYELEYGIKDFQQGMGNVLDINESSSVIISSVGNVRTEYDYYIRAKCKGVFGEWSSKNTFSSAELYLDLKHVQNSNIVLYPNPAGEIVQLSLATIFDRPSIRVSIYDRIGTLWLTSEYKDQYNLSSLPAGIYILKVVDKLLSETLIFHKK